MSPAPDANMVPSISGRGGRDDRADLPAVEPEIQEMERDEIEDGDVSELPGEVDEMNAREHEAPTIAFFYYLNPPRRFR